MRHDKAHRNAFRLLSLALAFLLCGCAADVAPGLPASPDTPNPGIKNDSAEVLNLTANLQPAPLQGSTEHAAAISDFAAKLFAEAMKVTDENAAISPLSAYFALAMAADGAKEETLAEFAALLGLQGAELDALCAGLMEQLMQTEGSTALSIANSVWIDTSDGLVVEESWLNTIKAAMQAEAVSADLSTTAARKAINAWVNEKTNGLIPTLRDENYDDDVMLVILNTLYLKAKWEAPFKAKDTHEADFTVANGSTVQADFMADWHCCRNYIALDGVRGTLLPYDDGKTAFLALMPKEGEDVRAFAATLSAAQMQAYLSAVQEDTLMNLQLPKFTAETTFPMNDALKAMGLVRAFDANSANLTAMGSAGRGPLYIGNVMQKVKLIVDEAGTEAAAVTAVEIQARAAMPTKEPIELCFDRPFAYAVIDLASGVPLFMGVVENPGM